MSTETNNEHSEPSPFNYVPADPVELMRVIGDALGLGSAARSMGIYMTNIENLQRRTHCLDAVEREFLTVERPDEDEPGEMTQECLVSWGADPKAYVEQFRVALADTALHQAAVEAEDAARWRAFRRAAANMDLAVLEMLERHIPDGNVTPAELETAIDEAIDAARKELGA